MLPRIRKLRRGDRLLVFILILLFLLSLLYPLMRLLRPSGQLMAIISQNGVENRRIALTQVEQPYTFTLYSEDGTGYNIIEVERGRIRVAEANCPNQVDVRAGWLTHAGDTAVCLPHRLVIELKGSADPEFDFIVR